MGCHKCTEAPYDYPRDMRVLVVEDDAKLAGYLRQALHEEGYAVDVAHTGTEGSLLANTM